MMALMATAPFPSIAGEESGALETAADSAAKQRPSSTCDDVKPGSNEAMVCADAEISALDAMFT